MPTRSMRILVVANKSWECEPLVNALLAKDARPSGFTSLRRGFDPAGPPRDGTALAGRTDGLPFRAPLPVRPRLTFSVGRADVEIWCVEDWMREMRRTPTGVAPASSSSSYEKFVVALPTIREFAFEGQLPDLVIAFGTAGIPSEVSFNGCVTVGNRVYLNDPWDDAEPGEVDSQRARFGPLLGKEVDGWVGRRIDSAQSDVVFDTVRSDARFAAEARFVPTPIGAATPPRILWGKGYAALSTINICDYDDYIWADHDTLSRFDLQVKQREIGSSETTHGLIRITWPDVPFMFVTAITDRVPYFNAEVTPRKYSQNFAASHNAGVALAHLLPELERMFSVGTFPGGGAVTSIADGKPLPPAAAAPATARHPGETSLDLPWADLARSFATLDVDQIQDALRSRTRLVAAISSDSASGVLDLWGECLNIDENSLATIVHPPILSALAAIANRQQNGASWHAGLTHTYGYLFSLLRTPFGFKRRRWVAPDLGASFALPDGLLGPNPQYGTLLRNITLLFAKVAFADEPDRFGRIDAPPELAALAIPKRRRIIERVDVSGESVECRTDLVQLPRPSLDSHLLVYSVKSAGVSRLITGFPIGPATAQGLLASHPGGNREVRTRYNAYVPGLTRMGEWAVD